MRFGSYTLLLLTAVALCSPAAFGADGARARLQSAIQLYDDLEYEKALAELKKAEGLAASDDETAEVKLLQGIVLAELGRNEAAAASLKQAFALRPALTVPFEVSPKIQRLIERTRPKPKPADAPRQTALASSPRASEGDDFRPGASKSLVHPVPTVSWFLAGTAAACAGVGTTFGVLSRARIRAAQQAPDYPSASAELREARAQTLYANVFFGVAGAALTAAVVTYFVQPGAAAAASE